MNTDNFDPDSQTDKMLPSGLPHVAYVLLWYPLFTQPFIFREVECLRKVLPVEVYTLYGQNLRHCSEEMKQTAVHGRSYGMKAVFSVCFELGKEFCKNPRLIWKLFKRSCCRKWPNLETFGENLWGFIVGVTLGRQFKEDGIDFVYAPWPRGSATAAWVGAELAGIPFAIAARGDNLAPADPDLGDKLEAATFVRANNAADQKRIEVFADAQAQNKTVLIYNSLTLPVLPNDDSLERLCGKTINLLALGRFDVTKGFDILLKACAILKQQNVNFHLYLAGGGGKVMGLGDLGQSLRDLRHQLHLENEVEMPGLISHDNLPALLKKSDIFVAPCVIHESGRRDGIPNTVIEAMAYGLPIVSTNVNALPEIVRTGETGIAVRPNDPQALADAITWIAEHPQEARKFGSNGAKLAASIFDPQTNARSLADIFINYHSVWKKSVKEKKCVA